MQNCYVDSYKIYFNPCKRKIVIEVIYKKDSHKFSELYELCEECSEKILKAIVEKTGMSLEKE